MAITPAECGFCIPTICIRSLNLEFILRGPIGGTWRASHGRIDMTYCIKEINCKKQGTTSHHKKLRLPPFTPHAPESGLLFAGYDDEGINVRLDDVNICFEVPELVRGGGPDSVAVTTFGTDLTPEVCCKKIKVGTPPVETDCCTGVKEALCACMNYRAPNTLIPPAPTFPGEDCCAHTSWPVSMQGLGFRDYSGGYGHFHVPDSTVDRVTQEFSNQFHNGDPNGPSGPELMASEVQQKIEEELRYYLRFCNYESARGMGGFNPEPSIGTTVPEPGPYYPLTSYDWRPKCVCPPNQALITPWDPESFCPKT